MAKAGNAELRVRETIAKANTSDIARQQALAEAAKVNEELRLYKVQYANIQKELERAQSEYDKMAELKLAAEDVASQAKQELRRMSMEREIERARGEAKREGLEEGYRRGIQDGREEGQFEEQQRATEAYEKVIESNVTSNQPLQSLAQFADVYFRGPDNRTRMVGNPRMPIAQPDPTRFPQGPTPVTRMDMPVPDTAPIVDNLPIRSVTTPVLQSDVGRQVHPTDSFSAPPSVRNAPSSPVFHGRNIDPAYIVSSNDGRIDLPPPHGVDPNPALSPTPSAAELMDSQQSLDEGGDYYDNGALPLQNSRQIVRRSRLPDGSSPPVSSSSASTHISNFAIVRDTTDFANQDLYLGGGQRSIPYRNSTPLSVIPEGSNIDASPDFNRRVQEFDRDPRVPSPSSSFNITGMDGQWVDHPDSRETFADKIKYSTPRESGSRMRQVPPSWDKF